MINEHGHYMSEEDAMVEAIDLRIDADARDDYWGPFMMVAQVWGVFDDGPTEASHAWCDQEEEKAAAYQASMREGDALFGYVHNG